MNDVMQQNADGTWSPAKPLKVSWWVNVELWLRRLIRRAGGEA